MKRLIKDEIFSKIVDGTNHVFRMSDIPHTVRDTDIIDIERADSEDDITPSYSKLSIIRERLETDDEYNERFQREQAFIEKLRQRRYAEYLRLKQEFES